MAHDEPRTHLPFPVGASALALEDVERAALADTSWLGWRWCFFIAVPFTVVAFALLTKTLRVPTLRRSDVSIDYWSATFIAADVSVLLIWVTFVGNEFDWLSWQTAAIGGRRRAPARPGHLGRVPGQGAGRAAARHQQAHRF
ncbi:hypothetical protein AB0K16_10090 [Nonomuraea jabiensis]|uniref:hypothetical protein n=1 Tax=Nonomuraea jabiensis TaxID=882448 RepID=UPI0034228794